MTDTITLPRATVQQRFIDAFHRPQQQDESDRWVIEKVDDKLLLNGAEIGPGTIEVRLDGLTYRSSEKVEVRQQAERWCMKANGCKTECGNCPNFPLAQQQAEPVGEVIDERGEVDYISYVPPVGTALYTTPPKQQAEPVAYIHRQFNHYEVSERLLLDDEKARGWTEEPLYTTPPQRKPLTDEDITKVIDSMPRGINGWMSDWDLYEFTRAVEAAHGIKEGT